MTRLIRKLRHTVFLVVALATVIGAGSGPVAAQQGVAVGDSYTSELSGMDVVASGEFEITDSEVQNYDEGQGELVYIESPDALLHVSFFDDTDDPETTLALFNDGFASQMDGFTVIQDGTDGDLVWSVSSATLDDIDYYHYLSVMPDIVGNVDLMTVLIAPGDVFFDSFEAAQEDITVDGEGILAEVDRDELQAVIQGDATTDVSNGQTSDTPASGTSGANVVVSEVSGIEIGVNDPWAVTDSEVFGDAPDDEESLTIRSDFANGNIGFFTGENAEDSLNEFLGGFESSAQERVNVANDYRRGVAWSLDTAVLGDRTGVVLYTEMREDIDQDYLVLVAIVALPEDFSDQFVSAQENMTIDGAPVFEDVDVADLEDTLAEGSSATGDVLPTPKQDATETGSSGKDIRRQNAKLPDNRAGTTGGNETETGKAGQGTGTTGQAANGTDLSDAGLISDALYTSPQFDIDVEWGKTWFVDRNDDEAVTSDIAGEMDSLILNWDGDDFALMFIDISTADGLIPDDFVTYWTSDDYMAENAEPNAEILLDRARSESGAVLTRDYLSDGSEVLILKEAVLLDDGEHLAIVTLIAAPDMYGDVYADADSDVEISGAAALNTFTPRQIERALDA